MLKLFRSNQPFTALVITGLSGLLLAPIFTSDLDYLQGVNLVNIGWIDNKLALFLFAWSSITGASMMLNRFFVKGNLHTIKNYIPSILYVLFATHQFYEIGFQWAFLANIFLILSLMYLFPSFHSIDVGNKYFRAGFWLGWACLLNPSLVFLFFAYLFVIIQNRTFKIREWLILLSAFALPFLYQAVYNFLFNDVFSINLVWQFNFRDISINPDEYIQITFISLIIISTILGLLYYFRSYSSNVKETLIARNSFIYLVIAAIPTFLITFGQEESFGLLSILVPFVCLITFLYLKNVLISNVLFFITIIGLILIISDKLFLN